jgi:hypothetical protein
MKNTSQWIEHLEEVIHFDLNVSQLFQFFVEHFINREEALLSLDYALMEKYGDVRTLGDKYNTQSELVVNEARKIGLTFLHKLEKLGCFTGSRLDYSFAQVIDTDTLLLWKPDVSDTK